MGSSQQRVGKQVEELARNKLVMLGLRNVQRIHTGMTKRKGRWVHTEAVDGDFTAIAPGGRFCLVEVKSRKNKLPWSSLTARQHRKLKRIHECGGLSIIVWADNRPGGKLYAISWSSAIDAGWSKGTAMDPDMAKQALEAHPMEFNW